MKRFKILLSVLAMSFIVGCGGGSGGSSSIATSAEEILNGNTFYYTDMYLDFEDGYYTNHFTADTLTETEHMPDGTIIDQWTLTVPINYSGTTVIVTDEGISQSCEVTGTSTYATVTCPPRPTYILWKTLEDAKANPQQ